MEPCPLLLFLNRSYTKCEVCVWFGIYFFTLGKKIFNYKIFNQTNPTIEKFNNKIYTLVPEIVPSQVPCPVYGLKTFMLSLQICHFKTFRLC